MFPKIDGVDLTWSSQFLVSTHSSHVANRASFSAIRYFRLADSDAHQHGRHADVLDLSRAENLDDRFLHQYLTLTRSDLFFADKAILVEGTSERLIIPKAIEKNASRLSSQYVTLLEVGGAYAYKFFPLLDFLGLPSLIITDIDTIGFDGDSKKRSASLVSVGDRTSNTTIKRWFSNVDITPAELLSEATTQGIKRGNRYLAYQVPETTAGACGRSFEDAFILANPSLFGCSFTENAEIDEQAAQVEAATHKKSDFALQFAIDDTTWITPQYIQSGLDWLLNFPQPETVTDEIEDDGAVVVR